MSPRHVQILFIVILQKTHHPNSIRHFELISVRNKIGISKKPPSSVRYPTYVENFTCNGKNSILGVFRSFFDTVNHSKRHSFVNTKRTNPPSKILTHSKDKYSLFLDCTFVRSNTNSTMQTHGKIFILKKLRHPRATRIHSLSIETLLFRWCIY